MNNICQHSGELRGRIARLNKYVLVVALLWAATFIVLLFAARPSHAHVTQPQALRVKRLASVHSKRTDRVVIFAPAAAISKLLT